MKSKADILANKLAKSERFFQAAEGLAKLGQWESVVNRLYYSAFHAVSALTYQQGVETKTHRGLRNGFHEHFIKTGAVREELGDVYQMLFQNRHDADYSDIAVFDEKVVEPLVQETRKLLQEIRLKITE